MSATVFIEFDDGSSLVVESVHDPIIDKIMEDYLYAYPFSHKV